MKCPVCANVDLLMTERHGVEIDYCSSCRGVWLDRGELDKIREAVAPVKENTRGRDFDDDDFDDRRGGRRKKESLLSNIFDF